LKYYDKALSERNAPKSREETIGCVREGRRKIAIYSLQQ
jgi:hypothetical protein